MKITIEGWEDNPVIFDGVEEFHITVKTGDCIKRAMACSTQFISYVSARVAIEANKSIIDDIGKAVELHD